MKRPRQELMSLEIEEQRSAVSHFLASFGDALASRMGCPLDQPDEQHIFSEKHITGSPMVDIP